MSTTLTSVTSLAIVLQHDIDEQYQYQPGEIIRGTIMLTVGKPTTIKEITIKVYSEGNVSWKDSHEEMFQAQEVYVDSSKAVVDTSNDLEHLRLPAGSHEFPFDYFLPENVPSSYIGKHGNVTYTIKVTVLGANSRETAISSEPFLVLRRAQIPALAQQPLVLTATRRMPCSCSFGTLDIRVALDRGGGVPGEDVFLHAEIKNQTGRTVTAMQASLTMVSLFRAKKHSQEFKQVVSKKRDDVEIPGGEGRRWTQVRLPLPPYIPESKLEFCDIIELDYIFEFRVELTGGQEIRLEAPFWIGAQPLGLEVPANERMGEKIHRQWTVRGSQYLAEALSDVAGEGDYATEGTTNGGYNIESVPAPDYDDDTWGVPMVPEMRAETVVANPLFQQQPDYITRGVKVIPDALLENTKL